MLINKHKEIGTSLDENINNDENNISNVLENHENNYYMISINDNCYTIKQIYSIVLVSFIIWAILFGIFKNKLSQPNSLKYLILIFLSLLGGCCLFTCFNYINKHYVTYEIIITIFLLTLSSSFGYAFTFILCELHTNYSNNINLNSFIIILISISSGIALTIGSIVILFLNKKIYEKLKVKCGDEIAQCCCNPISIMINILLSIFLIQIGRSIMFESEIGRCKSRTQIYFRNYNKLSCRTQYIYYSFISYTMY